MGRGMPTIGGVKILLICLVIIEWAFGGALPVGRSGTLGILQRAPVSIAELLWRLLFITNT